MSAIKRNINLNLKNVLIIFIFLFFSNIGFFKSFTLEKNNLFLGNKNQYSKDSFLQIEENAHKNLASESLLEQINDDDYFDFNPKNELIKINAFSNKSINRRYNLDENRTKCMDGSRYGVYYSPGYDKGKKKLFIGFEGMNWCYGRKGKFNPKSCKVRTNFYWGSSKPWKNEYIYDYNFYGGEENKNKQFFNWHRFIIPYCDGTGNQGYKTENINADGTKLFFKGFENTLESLKYIFKHVDLKTLDSVVVFGCSSGGWAAFQWMHLIENYLEKKKSPATLMGVFAGGYFIDYKNKVTKDNDFLQKFINMYDFVNKESPAVNKECLKKHKEKPYLCLMPEILINYIKSPIILFQAQYDSWQIDEVLGEKCVGNSRSMRNCNETQKKGIIEMRNYTMKKLKKALRKKSNLSIFSPACVFHCFGSLQRMTNEITVNNLTIDTVLSDFINSKGKKQIKLIDNFDWPNNKRCAY